MRRVARPQTAPKKIIVQKSAKLFLDIFRLWEILARMQEKTNAIRIVEKLKLAHKIHTYDSSRAASGVEVAAMLGQNPDRVFKTLVSTGKSGKHYVFIIPVAAGLDLKKAAKLVGEKSVEMLKQKDLLPLTGYVHGGCSPIGMKKLFPTAVDSTALNHSEIIFSGGRIGLQLELSPADLQKAVRLSFGDLTTAPGCAG